MAPCTRSSSAALTSLVHVLGDDAIVSIALNLFSIPLYGAFGIINLSQSCKALHALLHELAAKAENVWRQAWKCSFEWRLSTTGLFSDEENAHNLDYKICSPAFATSLGHNFRILLFPNGNKSDHLSVYLLPDATLPKHVSFTVAVINQKDSTKSIVLDAMHDFARRDDANEPWGSNDWGFRSTLPLRDLRDPRCGFLVDDNIVVSMSVRVSAPSPWWWWRDSRVAVNNSSA